MSCPMPKERSWMLQLCCEFRSSTREGPPCTTTPLLSLCSGVTPFLQLLREGLNNPDDQTEFKLLYASTSVDELLMRGKLDMLAQVHCICAKAEIDRLRVRICVRLLFAWPLAVQQSIFEWALAPCRCMSHIVLCRILFHHSHLLSILPSCRVLLQFIVLELHSSKCMESVVFLWLFCCAFVPNAVGRLKVQ